MGVDREDFPIRPIAGRRGIQPLSVKQREWFEDLVARAGL